MGCSVTELKGTMEMLLGLFGDTITVYPHQGYNDDDGSDFWETDQGVSGSGTSYTAIVEDTPSQDTVESPGFVDEAEIAFYTETHVADEGDHIEYNNETWVVVSVSDLKTQDELDRCLIGAKSASG